MRYNTKTRFVYSLCCYYRPLIAVSMFMRLVCLVGFEEVMLLICTNSQQITLIACMHVLCIQLVDLKDLLCN